MTPLAELLAKIERAIAPLPAERRLSAKAQLLLAAVLDHAEQKWPGIEKAIYELHEVEDAATQPMGAA